MNEWLDSHVLYWHWVVAGLVLMALEMFMPAFFMLWLGISAVVVGLVMLLTDMAFTTQILLWTVLSIVCLVAWFRFLSPIMKTKSLSGMALESMIGKAGTVLEYSSTTARGRMRFSAPLLGNDEWEVICEHVLVPGDRVQVIELSGNSLVVKKV